MSLLYRLEAKIRSAVPARLGTAVWQDLYHWPLVKFPQSSDDVANIRWATSDDRGLLVQRDGAATATYRLAQGNEAVIFTGSAGIEGIAWFARELYDDMDTRLKFPLQANQAWLFGAWVSRNMRGRGVYRRLISFAVTALREQAGIDQIFLAIDRSNRRSRAVHERLGTSRMGSVCGGRLFGRSQYRVKIGDQIQRCSLGTTMRVDLAGNRQ